MGKGAPAGTTMTPAFLSYNTSFKSNGWGSGAAMAFIVFLIIVLLTGWQRRLTLRAVDLMHSNHGTGPTP
jgi:multiple sugar transport system permease protein